MKKILSIIVVMALIVSVFSFAAIANELNPSYELIVKSVADKELILTFVLKDCTGMEYFDAEFSYDSDLLKYKRYTYGEDFYNIRSLDRSYITIDAVEHNEGTVTFGAFFSRSELLSSEEYDKLIKQANKKFDINGEYCKAIDFVFELKDIDFLKLDFEVEVSGLQSKILTVEVFEHKHTFSGDWVQTRKPTCTYVGSEKKVCDKCKFEMTREIDIVEHNYSKEFTVDLEPRCVYSGEKSRHCLDCGYRTDITNMPPQHKYGEWYIVEELTTKNAVQLQADCQSIGVFGCAAVDMKKIYVTDFYSWLTTSESKASADGVNVCAGVTVNQLLSSSKNNEIAVIDKDGKHIAADCELASGMTVALCYDDHVVFPLDIIIKGDVDGDGAISSSDARLALRAAVGLENLSDWQVKAANVQNSDKPDAAAARLILRASVGLEDADLWI